LTGLIILALVTTSGIGALIAPSASAAPSSQADCEAVGGVWNVNPTGATAASCSLTAAHSVTGKSLDWQVQSYIYYKALSLCVAHAALPDNGVFFDRINEQNAAAGNWFAAAGGLAIETRVVVSTYFRAVLGSALDSNHTTIDCGNPALVKGALALWGYDSPTDALCDFGFLRVDYNSKDLCKGSSGAGKDFYRPGGVLETFRSAIKSRVYNGSEPKLSDALLYAYYRGIFAQSCAYNKSAITESVADSAPDYKFAIFDVPDSGIMPTSKSFFAGVMKRSDTVLVVDEKPASTSTDLFSKSCADVEKRINDLAQAYADYRLDHIDEASGPGQTGGGNCAKDPEASGCSGDESQSSCNIPQLGWVLCPVLTVGASLADDMYNYLVDSFLLPTDPSLVNTDPQATTADGSLIGTGTYTAWKAMQGFGNVAFILVFLVIIFSQLTNVGVSNFGIKRLLPRLIMAAILVNLSFLICQLAVDASNILGYGLKNLFAGIADQINASGIADTTGNDGNLLGGLVAGAIIGGLVWVNIGALVVAVVGGLVALFTIFVLLVARKALIVLLIAIAPIAFVAYLLPNTEPLFHKWRKTLTSLLMLFPVIGALYGASILASAVIKQVAGDDPTMNIAAYIILVVPLVAAIPLLKGSLSAVGAVGNAINNLGNRTGKSLGGAAGKRFEESRVGQFRKYRGQERARRRALSRSGIDRFGGGAKNPLNWGKATQRGLNRASGKFGRNLSATGAELAAGMEAEQTKATESLIRTQITSGKTTAKQELDRALRSGDAVRARAAQNILYSQGSSGHQDFYDTVTKAQREGYAHKASVAALRANINETHGQLVKTKTVDTSKWAAKGGNLESFTANPDTWAGMSEADLSTQTGDSLTRGALAGLIDPGVAGDLLENGLLNGNLDDKQKAALRYAAGRGPAPGGGGGTGPAPGGGGGGPAPGGGGNSPAPGPWWSPPSGGGSPPGGSGAPTPGNGPTSPGGSGDRPTWPDGSFDLPDLSGDGQIPGATFEDGDEFTVPRNTEEDLDRFESEELDRRRRAQGDATAPEEDNHNQDDTSK